MNDLSCPWCEGTLEMAPESVDGQQCPDCLTTWTYEVEEEELALAA
jgi:Zn-finger nucleic acid-binding protein